MAVFKVFPEKDTCIHSAYPYVNEGKDSILEISSMVKNDSYAAGASRILMKFPLESIYSLPGNNDYKVFLKLLLADSYNLPDQYSLIVNPLSQSWEEGLGKFLYDPEDTQGSSWARRNNEYNWISSSFSFNTTASFQTGNPGGGVWFYSLEASQSFSPNDDKDTNIDVTDIFKNFQSEELINEGLIIRMEKDYEFNTSSLYKLSYFSRDSHTVYPPHIELKWDDSEYVTSSAKILNDENISLSFSNNLGRYGENDVYKFIINAREKYPKREFTTSSVYVNNKGLPSSSYWAIQDYTTGEYVINFDPEYTKISYDGTNNYFLLYMSGLQAERYYNILVKVGFPDGSCVIYDSDATFKIKK